MICFNHFKTVNVNKLKYYLPSIYFQTVIISIMQLFWPQFAENHIPTLHVSNTCKGFNNCQTFFFKIVKIHCSIAIFGLSKKNAFIGEQTSIVLVHCFLKTDHDFQKLLTNSKSFLVKLQLGYMIALQSNSGTVSTALASSKPSSPSKHTEQERLAKPGSLADRASQWHSGVQPS